MHQRQNALSNETIAMAGRSDNFCQKTFPILVTRHHTKTDWVFVCMMGRNSDSGGPLDSEAAKNTLHLRKTCAATQLFQLICCKQIAAVPFALKEMDTAHATRLKFVRSYSSHNHAFGIHNQNPFPVVDQRVSIGHSLSSGRMV